MRARLGVAFALALCAGCGGGSAQRPDGDAATDTIAPKDGVGDDRALDAVDAPRVDLGTSLDVALDVGAAQDVPPDADADATPRADVTPEAIPEAGPSEGGARDGGPEGRDADGSTACPWTGRPITLPTGPIAGVLSGPSLNPVVSCNTLASTNGPEAFFTLKVDAPTIVELGVESAIATFIAVRAGCGDDGSEIACSDLPLGVLADPGDAGVAPVDAAGTDAASDDASTTTGLLSAALRVHLAPGTYTVIVDTDVLGAQASADFTFTARALPPASNASCAAPQVLSSSAASTHGNLDLVGWPQVDCTGTSDSALYYAVGVPSGQRLTARVQAMGGNHSWMPRIEALASCGAGACLAQGHTAAGATQQLDWINNGASWRLVTLAVATDGPVNGAAFQLDVGIADLFATCTRPTPVRDATTLINQDLGAAAPPVSSTCSGVSDHALYYSAMLLPQQQLTVTATSSGSQNGFPPPVTIRFRTSCDGSACVDNGDPTFTNSSSETQTILIEATAPGGIGNSRFDLQVSMPPPPAGITVEPQAGLVTSEAGTSATFTVVLTSPPTATVTLNLASDTPTEGAASPSVLHFDATNWDQPQTVTITGVDDQLSDGPRRYTIVTAAAVSADPRYTAMDAPDVAVTNLDDDPGLTFVGADALVTSEAGTTASFQVRLNSKPTDTVKVSLTSGDVSEGTVSPAELTFSPVDWNTLKTVTVTGVDDANADGTQAYAIVTAALVSADASYAGKDPPDVVVHNTDDDLPPVSVKLLSGDAVCSVSNHASIARDTFNNLYVAMYCTGQLVIVTSTDGGLTFSAQIPVPDTADFGGDFALAGGDGGIAYLVYEVPGTGFVFTRTADGGLTWSPRRSLGADSGSPQLAAAGNTVVASASGLKVNQAGSILVRSVDGGQTFFPQQFIADAPNLSAFVEPDAKTVWLADFQGGTLRKSTDAGATFTTISNVTLNQAPVVVGRQSLFVPGGSSLFIASLADPTMPVAVDGLSGSTLAIAVDDVDTATVVQTSPDGTHVEAVRFVAGSTPTAGKVVGPRADLATSVALSRRAVATLIYSGGLALFTVTTW
jgi:hypothetical protein